jgi:hypothetical protein
MATIPELSKNELWVINDALKHRYRRQFFNRVHQKYGTDIEEYTDLTGCAVSLLQMQAGNHAKNSVTRNHPQ